MAWPRGAGCTSQAAMHAAGPAPTAAFESKGATRGAKIVARSASAHISTLLRFGRGEAEPPQGISSSITFIRMHRALLRTAIASPTACSALAGPHSLQQHAWHTASRTRSLAPCLAQQHSNRSMSAAAAAASSGQEGIQGHSMRRKHARALIRTAEGIPLVAIGSGCLEISCLETSATGDRPGASS